MLREDGAYTESAARFFCDAEVSKSSVVVCQQLRNLIASYCNAGDAEDAEKTNLNFLRVLCVPRVKLRLSNLKPLAFQYPSSQS